MPPPRTASTDQALRAALDEFCKVARVVLYHDEEDFRSLWSFPKDVTDHAVVIYWRGFPATNPSGSGDGNFRPHNWYITPYHWALALAHVCRRRGTKVPPVYVLHFFPAENANEWDAFGRAWRMSGLRQTWVRGIGLVGNASLAPLDDLRNIAQDKHTSEVDGALGLLNAALLRQVALEPDDRHTVSNLIGPTLLATAFGVDSETQLAIAQRDAAAQALLTLLRELGWLEGWTGTGASASFSSERARLAAIDPLGGLRATEDMKLRYYLLDDQAAAGYARVLASVLEAELLEEEARPAAKGIRPTLAWSTQPHQILAWIKRACNGGSSGFIDGVDVLFLDLRLWLGGLREDGVGRDVLQVVVRAADEMGWSTSGDSDPALARAYEAAKFLVENRGYPGSAEQRLAALALLPLIVSCGDPSLQIVLFSSTKQRRVLELLKHRSNIHTGFAKPDLGDLLGAQVAPLSGAEDEEALVHATAGQLVHAVSGAMAKVRLRPVWARITFFKLNAPRYAYRKQKYNVGGKDRYWMQGLRVGGVNGAEECAEWQLDEQRTVDRLKQLYARLSDGDVAAVMGGCWEALESGYSSEVQKRLREELEFFLPDDQMQFLDDPKEFSAYRYVLLAKGLRMVRNFKAHGRCRHEKSGYFEGDAIMIACSALLVALIDYLEQRAAVPFKLPLPSRPKGGPEIVRNLPDRQILGHLLEETTSDALFALSALISHIDLGLPHRLDDPNSRTTVGPRPPAGADTCFYSTQLMQVCTWSINNGARLV